MLRKTFKQTFEETQQQMKATRMDQAIMPILQMSEQEHLGLGVSEVYSTQQCTILRSLTSISDFDVIKELGKGAFGEVSLVTMKNVPDSAKYAVKAVDQAKAIKKVENDEAFFKLHKEYDNHW